MTSVERYYRQGCQTMVLYRITSGTPYLINTASLVITKAYQGMILGMRDYLIPGTGTYNIIGLGRASYSTACAPVMDAFQGVSGPQMLMIYQRMLDFIKLMLATFTTTTLDAIRSEWNSSVYRASQNALSEDSLVKAPSA
jgi:hypothetical protein